MGPSHLFLNFQAPVLMRGQDHPLESEKMESRDLCRGRAGHIAAGETLPFLAV